MNSKIEFRAAAMRAAGGKDSMVLEGTAAAYNTLSADLGGFRETIAPGAFDLSLSAPDSDVKMLAQHDPSQILGRQKNGTLKVWADSRGLQFRCTLCAENSMHRDLYALVKAGTLSEMSFAFIVEDGGDSWNNNTKPATRTLRNVKLLDCSVVTSPAYPTGTAVDARARAVAARKSVPTSGKPVKRGVIAPAPSEEVKDSLRRAQAAVIGDLVAADKAEIRDAETKNHSAWRASILTLVLEKKGYRYLDHDDRFVYGAPSAFFDPDWSDDQAAMRCVRWPYEIVRGEVTLGEGTTNWSNDMVRYLARGAFDALRSEAKLRARMRSMR